MIDIDSRFPGGNILTDRIDGNDVYLRPDLRDTRGDWFYWYFRVRGGAGRTLRFHLSSAAGLELLTAAGPACSLDGGQHWNWLGAPKEQNTFTMTFPADADEARFCTAVPYTQSHFEAFLETLPPGPHLKTGVLTTSPKSRPVEMLHVGRLNGTPPFCVVLCARSHSCETMASYVLEGTLRRILAADAVGTWLRKNVEFLVVPFVDKDGVEDGDQGKNRNGHDHYQDFIEDNIYPETGALMRLVSQWSTGRLCAVIDLHCPWIRGGLHETIHFVGSPDPDVWDQQQKFSALLAKHRHGSLEYRPADNLPFGESWNNAAALAEGRDISRWATEQLGVPLATTCEFPYAVVHGRTVTPDAARAFGEDLTVALRSYLGKG